MPVKSLGTLAIVYGISELQNPIPRKAMLCKGDMNNSASRSDVFLQRYGLQLATQHCMVGGRGLALPLLTQKRDGTRKILQRHWCSNYFWQWL